MAYQRLFIFVEGSDDKLFFDSLIERKLYAQNYSYVECREYSQKTKEYIEKFLRSIKKMEDADYIFVADMDESPCVTARKAQITSMYKNLTADRILIVCREIESWYLAGLNDDGCQQLGISADFKNTDDIFKEKFNDIMPSKFTSRRINFMLEIMNIFDQETAQAQNSSFRYCMQNRKWNKPL